MNDVSMVDESKTNPSCIGYYVRYSLAVLVFVTKMLAAMEEVGSPREQHTAGTRECYDCQRSLRHYSHLLTAHYV